MWNVWTVSQKLNNFESCITNDQAVCIPWWIYSVIRFLFTKNQTFFYMRSAITTPSTPIQMRATDVKRLIRIGMNLRLIYTFAKFFFFAGTYSWMKQPCNAFAYNSCEWIRSHSLTALKIVVYKFSLKLIILYQSVGAFLIFPSFYL